MATMGYVSIAMEKPISSFGKRSLFSVRMNPTRAINTHAQMDCIAHELQLMRQDLFILSAHEPLRLLCPSRLQKRLRPHMKMRWFVKEMHGRLPDSRAVADIACPVTRLTKVHSCQLPPRAEACISAHSLSYALQHRHADGSSGSPL